MLNLNPEIVDQERIRKLKRKRLLKITAVPAIILLIIGIFFLRTGLFNILFSASYNNGDFDSAKMTADVQSFANIISPYIMYFDRGDALFKNGQFKEAEGEYRTSLKENPPKSEICKIYVNLSLSVERQGDQYFNNNQWDEALVLYNSAEAILYEEGCVDKTDSNNSRDRRGQASKERIMDKKRRTMASINSSEGEESEGGNNTGNNQGLTEKDLEKIQSMQNQREAINNIRSGLGGGSPYSGSNGITW